MNITELVDWLDEHGEFDGSLGVNGLTTLIVIIVQLLNVLMLSTGTSLKQINIKLNALIAN